MLSSISISDQFGKVLVAGFLCFFPGFYLRGHDITLKPIVCSVAILFFACVPVDRALIINILNEVIEPKVANLRFKLFINLS